MPGNILPLLCFFTKLTVACELLNMLKKAARTKRHPQGSAVKKVSHMPDTPRENPLRALAAPCCPP
jgi:hypothetical protein